MRTPQELWDAALAVFDAARELDEPERSRLVDVECSEDVELRAEVESLLAHLQQAGDAFLRPVELGELAGEPEQQDPLLEQTISSFRVQSVIARGGMGTVYLAQQSSPTRNVAIKVLSPGFWSSATERRFAQEAQILARLQHPNIAQVYEAGSHKLDPGRVVRYFAMELVPDAKRITEFAAEHNLDIKERLTLFLPVCDAVQYGHSKGIIHRDLKPANILVGPVVFQASSPKPRAVVKVIDFGVARIIDTDVALTTMHTDTGQLIGTLAYMSPEQCDADPLGLDVRSDVYSLGVVLYELLCGQLPYEVSKTSIAAAATAIRDCDPMRPSLVFRQLRGDLETVLLKALEKDRDKRYASVNDLARDIRHWLDREPVEAKKLSRWARTIRWAVRNPKTVTPSVCVMIVLAVMGLTKYSVSIARAKPFLLHLISGRGHRHPEEVGKVFSFDSAELVALSGQTLGQWGGTPDSIVFGDMIKSVDSWDGKDIVIIGFTPTARNTYAGQICIFDANRPQAEPLRGLTVDQQSIDAMPDDAWPRPRIDPQRKYLASGFRLKSAALLDVFPPDGDGDVEIVAFHQHRPGSQGVLRIYDLHGDLLFQVWQDGGINDFAFMPYGGVLVCQAVKNDKRPEDYEPPIGILHPQVLFAIHPSKGLITNQWIRPTPPSGKEIFWFRHAWYKALCFSDIARTQDLRLWLAEPDLPPMESSRTVFMGITLQNVLGQSGILYNFGVYVDLDGNIVHRPPIGDSYLGAFQNFSKLPNPAERPGDLQLLEWNDENPPCGHISTESDDTGGPRETPSN